MTRAQEKLGRRIVAALTGIEFTARLVERRHLEACVEESAIGGAYVRVLHPHATTPQGGPWLVGLVTLEEEPPRLTYAVPVYREGLEAALRSVVGRSR